MLLLSSILSHFLQSQYLCYIRFTICSTFAFFNLSFSKKTTFLKEYSISAEDHPYFCAWHTEIIRLSFWRWWHKSVFANDNIIFFITLLYLQLSFGFEIYKHLRFMGLKPKRKVSLYPNLFINVLTEIRVQTYNS